MRKSAKWCKIGTTKSKRPQQVLETPNCGLTSTLVVQHGRLRRNPTNAFIARQLLSSVIDVFY
ncbi:MAG: hypothetical protein H6673_15805 [Anaerolineales bacterium]|nr:hypothetical protein [Anaerolineales bacterium]